MIDPEPARARIPLPVTSELPQCARLLTDQLPVPHSIDLLTSDRSIEGLIEIVWPVQASSPLPASIQSVVPSRLIVVMEVLEAFVAMSAVTGDVDDILW